MEAQPLDLGASILATIDEFVWEVPWGSRRSVLVFRRQHGGRTYLRFRTWNCHQERNV